MRLTRRRLNRWLALLGSLRLATLLVLLLAMACTVGGLVPQSPVTVDAEAIYRSYGLFWYRLVTRLQWDDVFGSVWFFALVGTFALNLLLCTGRRLRGSLRRAFGPVRFDDPCNAPRTSMRLPEGTFPKDFEQPVSGALRRAGYRRVNRHDGPGNKIHLMGHRRRWAALGADVVHVGILVILLGGLLGFFRQEGSFRVNEWQLGMRLSPWNNGSDGCALLPYDVQINAFGVETYDETSRIKNYWADVVLWEGENALDQQRVSVNRPMMIEETGLYVWRYGEDPDAARVRLQVVDTTRNLVTAEAELRIGETVPLPGSEGLVTAVRYFRSILPDESGKTFDLEESAGGYPAVLLQVEGTGGTGQYRDLALPMLLESVEERDIAFLLSDVQLPATIDLHITRNPGYPLFWWGFIIVMVGLAVAFYLRPSRVHVVIEANHLLVYAAGRESPRRVDRLAQDITSTYGLDLHEEASQ